MRVRLRVRVRVRGRVRVRARVRVRDRVRVRARVRVRVGVGEIAHALPREDGRLRLETDAVHHRALRRPQVTSPNPNPNLHTPSMQRHRQRAG